MSAFVFVLALLSVEIPPPWPPWPPILDDPIEFVEKPPSAANMQYFGSAEGAREHCPHDVVVWLSIDSGVYRERRSRLYGRTRRGAYVCRFEALAAEKREAPPDR